MSRKGPESRTRVPSLRSTGTKASTDVDRLRASNADLEKKLAEALERQAATSEVLQVIASSPGELEPVFQAMLANATRICEAKFGALYLSHGDGFRTVALHGAPPAFAEARRREPVIRPAPKTALGRAVAIKQIVQIADVQAEPGYFDDVPPGLSGPQMARLAGARTIIAVPMLKDNELIGAIVIYRTEVRPFTDKQIELVKNFAAQAIIAIENTRLLNELRRRTDDLSEALEQQTATSDVLQVISSSPGELQPVFRAMLESATRICEAKFGSMYLREGDAFRIVGMHNAPPAFAEARRLQPLVRPGPGTGLYRVASTKQVVHIVDLRAEQPYLEREPSAITMVERAGARTLLVVPMLKDNELIGNINIYRQEVRPFTNKQIELVQNFAAQAVIAIENTRLLNELRESLEQQTATSKVLSVISSSPGDLEPVFQAMLENATRICDAKFGFLFRYDDGAFQPMAMLNVPSALADFMRQRGPYRPEPGLPLHRLLQTKKAVHTIDQATEKVQTPSAKLAGARSAISVPMLKDNELLAPFPSIARGSPVHRQADRAADKFRQPGRHRHREYPPAQRAAPAHRRSYRGAGAADRHRRGAAGDLDVARRIGAGVPGHAGERGAHLRSHLRRAEPP